MAIARVLPRSGRSVPLRCLLHVRRAVLLVAGCIVLATAFVGCATGPSPSGAEPIRFALIADIQYGDKETQGARHYRAALQSLDACVSDLAQRDLACVVQLGDAVDGYAKDPGRSAVDHDAVMGILGRLRVPLFHVVGNHCMTLGGDVLRQRYGLDRLHYDFTLPSAPGWRFVVLDGNDAGYGVVSEGQAAWFGSVLRTAAAAGERVVCFCHFALLKEAAPRHRMARPEPLLEALDQSGCVVAWFAGHDHAGGYAWRNGVHHITLKGMVEAPVDNAYGVVELHPELLRLTGFGREPSRDLPLPPRAGPRERP